MHHIDKPKIIPFLLLFLIYLSLSSAVTQITQLTDCNDISLDQCQVSFTLSPRSPSQDSNSLLTETLQQANLWFGYITVAQSLRGSCQLDSTGLKIIAPDLNTNTVQCSFQISSGFVQSSIQITNGVELPAISFSRFKLEFNPASPSSGSVPDCSNPSLSTPCEGNVTFGTELLPLRIKTTSQISFGALCSISDGFIIGSDGDVIQIDISPSFFSLQLTTTEQDINTYELSLSSGGVPLRGQSVEINCRIIATKTPHSPYFYILKNQLALYRTDTIIYNTVRSFTTPICHDPTSPLCIVIFWVDDRIIDSITITPDSYFYQSSTLPTTAGCDLVLNNINIINVPQGMTALCAKYRIPIHTPEFLSESAKNPFIINSDASTFPMIKFTLKGPHFDMLKVTLDATGTIYRDVISSYRWDTTICNESTSPICPLTIKTKYQGPNLTLSLSNSPFAGIDYTYCFPSYDEQQLISITTEQAMIISGPSGDVKINDINFEFECIVGYYKGYQQSWGGDQNMDNIAINGYLEAKGALKVHHTTLDPTSTQIVIPDPQLIKYTYIPIKYTPRSDCSDDNALFCTLDFYNYFDQSLTGSMDPNVQKYNYLRSFEVYIPGIDYLWIESPDMEYMTPTGFVGAETSAEIIQMENVYPENDITNLNLISENVPGATKVVIKVQSLFHIEISQKRIGYHLHRSSNGNGLLLYTNPLNPKHTISIAIRKANGINLTQALPILLAYNHFRIPFNPSTQPPGLGSTNPFKLSFLPSMWMDPQPNCSDPTQSFCVLKFVRKNQYNPIIYIHRLSGPLSALLLALFSSQPAQFLIEGDPNGQVVIEIDLSVLIGPSALISPINYVPLEKPYGSILAPTLTLVDVEIDPVTFKAISKPNPNNGSLPLISVLRSFQFRLPFTYLTDLIPTFHDDCSMRTKWTCTVTWNSNGPLILQAGKPRTLIRHRIPTWSPTTPIPDSSKFTDLEFMAGVVQSRLGQDWSMQDGWVKEIIAPVSHDGITVNWSAYLEDPSILIPQMTPANLLTWIALLQSNPTAPTTPYELGNVTDPTSPLGDRVPLGHIYVWPELENDPIDGNSYIKLNAALNPLIVLIDPSKPPTVDNIDTLNSVLTGVLSRGVFDRSVFPPRMVPNGAGLPLPGISFTTTLGLWFNRPSQRLFVVPTLVHSLTPLRPEYIKPFVVPSFGYTPVDIYPHEDCYNSYKQGRLLCTFGGVIYGSPEAPIDNFTYLSLVKIADNPMIPDGVVYVCSEPIRNNEIPQHMDKVIGQLIIDRSSNYLSLWISPQYRTSLITAYLIFEDSNHDNDKSVLLKRPKLIAPLNTPIYVNIPHDPTDPVSTQATLTNILTQRTAEMVFPPYAAVGGYQGGFFQVPAILTGPLIQVYTNMTKFTPSYATDGLMLVQYIFNGFIVGDARIESDFGLKNPIPCISFTAPLGEYEIDETSIVIDFANPPISRTNWDKIRTKTEQFVNEFIKSDDKNLSTNNAKNSGKNIPLNRLPKLSDFSPILDNIINPKDNKDYNFELSAWLYPYNGGESILKPANEQTNEIPLYSTCLAYLPISAYFPSKTLNVLHHVTVRTETPVEFIVETPDGDDVAMVEVFSKQSAEASYPTFLDSSNIKPIEHDNNSGNGKGNGEVSLNCGGVFFGLIGVIILGYFV